jgi:hypothetical protein
MLIFTRRQKEGGPTCLVVTSVLWGSDHASCATFRPYSEHVQNMGREAQQAPVGKQIVGDAVSSPLIALRWRTRASFPSSLTLLPDTTRPCSLDGSARTCRRPSVLSRAR